MRIWIKNTNGKPDAVLTMTLVGFAVILLKLLLSGISITIMQKVISFGSIDATTIAAILTPTLGAYCTRRYTDRKYISHSNEEKKV